MSVPPGADAGSRPRRFLAIAGLLALLVLRVDLGRAPEHQLTSRALLIGIDAYQASLSPALASTGAACRFRPSCSRYAEGVIRKHGALGGAVYSALRVVRCGPWTPAGTADPP